MAAVSREKVCAYLDELLQPQQFRDACPNGLQVQGSAKVSHCVVGVTACLALIEQAVLQGADLVLVHHGLFWQGDPYPITGVLHQRLKTLLMHNINLFAYHLPLDCHSSLGNNAQIGQRLQLSQIDSASAGDCPNLLWQGQLPKALSADGLKQQLTECFSQPPVHVGPGNQPIRRLAWCSGAAQRYLRDAHRLGVDAFISGEISEQTTHLARELGVDYFGCGHHATERFGVQALGNALQQQFGLAVTWVDVPNPV